MEKKSKLKLEKNKLYEDFFQKLETVTLSNAEKKLKLNEDLKKLYKKRHAEETIKLL